MQTIEGKVDEERREARDREDRLYKKIGELSRQLTTAESREADAIAKIENLSQSLGQLQKQCVRAERANKKDKPCKAKRRALDGNDTTSEVLNPAEMPAASQSNDNQASSDEERS